MTKSRILQVKETEITVISQNDTDYISLTDMTVSACVPISMCIVPFSNPS